MMVSLHRLREDFPALGGGPSGRDAGIAEYSAALAGELRRLAGHRLIFRIGRFCPQDFLTLFSPERRLAVLNGAPGYRDWRYAAAVRLGRLIGGGRSGAVDAELADWRSDPLIARGGGAIAFVRAVLSGAAAPGVEAMLLEPPVWREMTILNFIAQGSTSRVYRVRRAGAECVLKVPCRGAVERFRREVELLRSFDHPNLPRLRAWSLGAEPYCVMDLCRTGRALRGISGCGAELAAALGYVHGRGLVHGDIRLCNLGIDPAGAPLLLDFSHARAAVSPEESAAETEKMKRLLA